MDEKNRLKQNDGAHQGNIHRDSNKGKNEDGHAGSTLKKGVNSEEVISENDDNVNTRDSETESHGGKQEPGSVGIS
ncbi:MAG TPA: hypothetical protein VL093_01075 [Flavipsychrobacter sp.]|jgi:hypothetical protein|nr:hypothetical protein [Flavipsychrobacter sp.]